MSTALPSGAHAAPRAALEVSSGLAVRAWLQPVAALLSGAMSWAGAATVIEAIGARVEPVAVVLQIAGFVTGVVAFPLALRILQARQTKRLAVFDDEVVAVRRSGRRGAALRLDALHTASVFGEGKARRLLLGAGTRVVVVSCASDGVFEAAREFLDALRTCVAGREGGAEVLARIDAHAHGFERTERKPYVTLAVGALAAAVFIAQQLLGGTWLVAVRLGANAPVLVADGEWWRLLTATFLHATFIHIYLNASALLTLGAVVERVLGAARFVLVLTTSAVAGAALSAALGAAVLSQGASTAIFGLLGAMIGLQYLGGDAMHPAYRLSKTRWVVLLLLNTGISFLPMVDAWAHLGGFVAGAATAIGVVRAKMRTAVVRGLVAASVAVWLAATAAAAASFVAGDERSTLSTLVKAMTATDRYSPRVRNSFAWEIVAEPGAPRDVVLAAEELARSAVRDAPESPNIRDTWAMSLHRLGRHDEAVREQRTTLKLAKPSQRADYEKRLRMFEAARDSTAPVAGDR